MMHDGSTCSLGERPWPVVNLVAVTLRVYFERSSSSIIIFNTRESGSIGTCPYATGGTLLHSARENLG